MLISDYNIMYIILADNTFSRCQVVEETKIVLCKLLNNILY